MKIKIFVNGPAYRGAEYPRMSRKKVNESKFSDGERFKEYLIEYDPNGRGTVEWLCQNAIHHTSGWSEEIKRAFVANGAKPGYVIDVKFGDRHYSFTEEFELVIGY